MKKLFLAQVCVGILVGVYSAFVPLTIAHDGEHTSYTEETKGHVFVFARDNCSFCTEQLDFLEAENLPYVYLDIGNDAEALRLYNLLLEKHSFPRVTPVSIVGEKIYLGFNGARTTGQQIKKELAVSSEIDTIEEHLDFALAQPLEEVAASCSGVTCVMGNEGQKIVRLPYFGLVDVTSPVFVTVMSVLIVTPLCVLGYRKRHRFLKS